MRQLSQSLGAHPAASAMLGQNDFSCTKAGQIRAQLLRRRRALRYQSRRWSSAGNSS